MAASDLSLDLVLRDSKLTQRIRTAKILLVGSGGIGCEVLKTLLLTGFQDIQVIDLDTIDVSNLNRQFLFSKCHVGQAKAKVASEVAVKRFAHKDVSGVKVTPILAAVQKPEFNVEFFSSFTLVINALDNRAARSHVNRLCLAADVPLIESGSTGYLGQVYLIKKGITSCYDCEGIRKDQKTYASCTIRNTPSQPIHCIVWAKHLFAQLFGEPDADNDVSPDSNDPELVNSAKNKEDGDKVENHNNGNGESSKQPQSTRSWAESNDYDPQMIFDKLFVQDIAYLLSMEKLWENRRKPVPLARDDLTDSVADSTSHACTSSSDGISLKDQRLWSLKECYDIFSESVSILKQRLKKDSFLVWDKDDDVALDFVTSVSNFRSQCFAIERKSRFDVKSMAGNIIPAISSTNSVVGGLIVLQALAILRNLPQSREEFNALFKEDQVKLIHSSCKTVYLKKIGINSKPVISSYELEPPNSHCIICSSESKEIDVYLPIDETSLVDLVEQVIVKQLHFACPDVANDVTGQLLWSNDDYDEMTDEEKNQFKTKKLTSFQGVVDNIRLKVYDLLQDLTMFMTLKNATVDPTEADGEFYKIVVTKEATKKEESIDETTVSSQGEVAGEPSEAVTIGDSDDELEVVPVILPIKRVHSPAEPSPSKRSKLD